MLARRAFLDLARSNSQVGTPHRRPLFSRLTAYSRSVWPIDVTTVALRTGVTCKRRTGKRRYRETSPLATHLLVSSTLRGVSHRVFSHSQCLSSPSQRLSW